MERAGWHACLYLEGAHWDEGLGMLVQSLQIFSSLHITIYFFPVPLEEAVPE